MKWHAPGEPMFPSPDHQLMPGQVNTNVTQTFCLAEFMMLALRNMWSTEMGLNVTDAPSVVVTISHHNSSGSTEDNMDIFLILYLVRR